MKMAVSATMAIVTIILVGLLATPTAGDQQPTKQDPNNVFPDLVGALKTTPGCLGVETAKTSSGKQVIFAWFEDKKSLLKWYHSDTHQQLMKQFFPDQEFGKPLKDIPSESGPILAIASITFVEKPRFKETSLPISQIAIELYQPMSGGVFLGSRFAPESVKVPNIRDYTSKEKK